MRKYLAVLVLFAGLEIGLALFLTYWRASFWDAVSLKHSAEFINQLGIFTCVALVICFVAGFSGYLISLTAIKWREILNKKALTITGSKIENFNQRVQDDCGQYPDLVLNLVFGTIKAVVYVAVFATSLLLSFHWWYLGVLLAYTIVGSLITKRIANPLIKLNYEQQRAEATYRNDLSITNFSDCVRIMLGLAKRQKHLTYFQQFYGQVGVIVPLIIVAPVYFTTGMSLGALMRFNSLSSTILDNMSFGINQFASINRLISCRQRLREAGVI